MRRDAGLAKVWIALIVVAACVLAGVVAISILVVTIPYSVEKSRQAACQNNLRWLGTILVSDSRGEGRWPRDGGAGFLLRLYFTHQDILKDIRVYACPGDEDFPFEPGSEQHRELFRKLDARKVPLEGWDDHITSYVGRNVREYPIRDDLEEKQAIACDRTDGTRPHHPEGVMVLFSDGKVEFLKTRQLGLDPDEPIRTGPGGPAVLEPLCFRP